MNKPENPYAFPVSPDIVTDKDTGMLLRDYFAAQAITSVTADFWNFRRTEEDYNKVAESAYKIADAMLKKRQENADTTEV